MKSTPTRSIDDRRLALPLGALLIAVLGAAWWGGALGGRPEGPRAPEAARSRAGADPVGSEAVERALAAPVAGEAALDVRAPATAELAPVGDAAFDAVAYLCEHYGVTG